MYSALALAFVALAAALPSPQAGTSTPLRFKGQALAEGTPIHLASINANTLQFVIGADTKASTPPDAKVDPANYDNNATIFSYLNGQGKLGLSSGVPAGQPVYVTNGSSLVGVLPGLLRCTPPQQPDNTAGPSTFQGFTTAYNGKLQFENKDWFACRSNYSPTVYDIFAASRIEDNPSSKGCIRFVFNVVQVEENVKSAYQYDF